MLNFRATVHLLLLLALPFAPSVTAQILQPVLVETGNQPIAIYTADMNADGIADLIVVDAGATDAASTTRVLLGHANGAFTQTAVIATAGKSIIVSDLLQNQPPGLIWASASGSTASLYEAGGQGDGTFGPTRLLTSFPLSGAQPPTLRVAVTDYRPHYARRAVVVEDTANATLYEAFLLPDSSFAIVPLYSYPGYPILANPTGLLTADFNADGYTDIVIQSSTGDQVILVGTPGGFSSTIHASPAGLTSTLLADMDGDHVLDLLTSDATGRIDIFRGNGDGTFSVTSEIGSSPSLTGPGSHLIAAADINGDGTLDLITATPLGITVLLGQSGLNYKLGGIYDPGQGNPTAGRTTIALADFNSDGTTDLAVDNPRGVLILFGKPDGSFAAPRAVTGILTASPEPSLYGSDFTLTATLNTPTGGTAPTGTITFSIDGTALTPAAPLNTSGTATYTVTAPTYIRGAHTLTAAYSGDANYSPQTLTGTHTIAGLRSQTTFTLTTPSIFYGQIADGRGSVAAIDSSGNATVNGGTISFYDGATVICVLPVNGSAGTCPANAGGGFPVGTHALTAAYSGNDFYAPSISDPGNVQVLPDDTTGGLTPSANPATVAQPVTLTATFSAPYATPLGTVTFFDGATPIGTGTLNAAGLATLTTSSLALGTHTLTARLAASLNFNASTSTAVALLVNPVPLPATTTLLSSSVNPSYVGQSVTFTATVTSGATVAAAPVAGSVTFMIDSVLTNPNALSAQGQATLTATALTQGIHTITAIFAATTTLAASTSAPLQQVVNAAGAGGFTLTVNPSTLQVPIGSAVSVLVTITPLNGFAQPVTLTCTGLPAEAACAFADTTIPSGGGSTRLTVSAAAPHNCNSTTPYFVSSGPTTLLDSLLPAALMLLLRRRRRLFQGIALALAFAILSTITGCASNCTDLGVRPNTYSFTVTATSTGTPSVTMTQAAQFTAHL